MVAGVCSVIFACPGIPAGKLVAPRPGTESHSTVDLVGMPIGNTPPGLGSPPARLTEGNSGPVNALAGDQTISCQLG
jgi:hypothetical protein